jgi:hypothetical protein
MIPNLDSFHRVKQISNPKAESNSIAPRGNELNQWNNTQQALFLIVKTSQKLELKRPSY